MHTGKLGQVTNVTIVGSTAKDCIDQYMVLCRNYSLGCDTAVPGRLHARLCHVFLVSARCNIYISRLCHDASLSVCDGSALVHYD